MNEPVKDNLISKVWAGVVAFSKPILTTLVLCSLPLVLFHALAFTSYLNQSEMTSVEEQASEGDSKLPRIEVAKVPVAKKTSVRRGALMVFLVGTFVLMIGCLMLPAWKDSWKHKPARVYLKDDSPLSKRVVEGVFGRHQVFKNAKRGWLHLQAIFVSLSISLVALSVLLGTLNFANVFAHKTFDQATLAKYMDDGGALLGLVGVICSLVFVVYNRLHQEYSSKWLYCANLYHKILEEGDPTKSVRGAALALDLLCMDLWAKRGFSKFFAETLDNAIFFVVDRDKQAEIRRTLEMGDLTENQVEDILEAFLYSRTSLDPLNESSAS